MNAEIILKTFCSVQEEIGKKCKMSGEKLILSPQISYIILRWNAVNAVKLCKFTARIIRKLTKIQHLTPLTTSYRPYTDAHLSPPACQASSTAPLLTKILRICFELNQIHSTFCKTYACKITGEITNFSDEIWWFFVS